MATSLIHLFKIVELSQQIENIKKEKQTELTAEHLNRFKEIFKSVAQLNSSRLFNERIFKEIDTLIQNYDVTSPNNSSKLLHLSQIILNNFSPKSADWILIIYKKIMNVSSEKTRHFTCLDLTQDVIQSEDLDSKFKYAKFLVKLLSHHVRQE